ncbi:OLC1v1004787C1 [Oldenlandia corymbosa var. corymbosa]|uniref:OLC1v1004787C1 n=1 Tax=Oldenlandia corymbosa var. corymbosa TaxID=529605 RepID=A0AAV1DFH8_OLDCO|nr:OLC1v1004787C1 [Oldenlandia corymbosa var. corymbosa]
MASFLTKKQPFLLLFLFSIIVTNSAMINAASSPTAKSQVFPTDVIMEILPFIEKIGVFQQYECWIALPLIGGVCTTDILRYIIGPQNGIISIPCCNVVRNIVEKCNLRNLPYNPIFPPTVLGVCA